MGLPRPEHNVLTSCATFCSDDLEKAQKVGASVPQLGGKSLPPGASEEDEKLSKGAIKKKKAKEKAQKDKEAAQAVSSRQKEYCSFCSTHTSDLDFPFDSPTGHNP